MQTPSIAMTMQRLAQRATGAVTAAVLAAFTALALGPSPAHAQTTPAPATTAPS